MLRQVNPARCRIGRVYVVLLTILLAENRSSFARGGQEIPLQYG